MIDNHVTYTAFMNLAYISYSTSCFLAAMALSGYPSRYYTDSTDFKLPASPNLNLIMNETNQQLINNFIDHLFHVEEEFFKSSQKLRPLLECTFASVLMYHGAMKNKFGKSHIITMNVIRCANEFLVNEKLLEDWGEIIRTDWVLRNTKSMSNNEENRVLIETLISSNERLMKINSKILSEMSLIKEDIRQMKKSNDQHEGMFQDIRQHIGGSPTKKRKQEIHYKLIYYH